MWRGRPSPRHKHRALERYIFVGDGGGVGHIRLRRTLVEVAAWGCGSTAAPGGRALAGLATAAQQHQVADYNLGHILLLSAGLVVPGMGLQASFNVNRASL